LRHDPVKICHVGCEIVIHDLTMLTLLLDWLLTPLNQK